MLHSNGQLRTERDGDTEKGCQKPAVQQKTTDGDGDGDGDGGGGGGGGGGDGDGDGDGDDDDETVIIFLT